MTSKLPMYPHTISISSSVSVKIGVPLAGGVQPMRAIPIHGDRIHSLTCGDTPLFDKSSTLSLQRTVVGDALPTTEFPTDAMVPAGVPQSANCH